MNQNTLQKYRRSLLAISLLSAATGASGASVTATFQVTASVAAQCSVTANNLAFGPVDPIGGAVDQSTTISVKCTKNSSYTVGLNAGTTAGATIASRRMGNTTTPAETPMNYNLYVDSGRNTIWGNSGTAPAWVSGTGAGMGTAQVLTVWGRVPAGQTNLAVGSYADTAITVTVTY